MSIAVVIFFSLPFLMKAILLVSRCLLSMSQFKKTSIVTPIFFEKLMARKGFLPYSNVHLFKLFISISF